MSDQGCRIERLEGQGMVTLRGDLGAAEVQAAVQVFASVDVPGRGEARVEGQRGACWMSPDELLLLCPSDEVAGRLNALQGALAGTHALAVDVSDARALFLVAGPNCRDVMARLAPVDVAPGQFEPGQFRRSRVAQVAAAFWMPDVQSFQLVCFRSHGQYVADLLKDAASSPAPLGLG